MTIINQILDSYFQFDGKKVLAVKGKWGVGKTYFINNYVRSSDKIQEKLISYVSLFGLESLADLKSTILSSAKLRQDIAGSKFIDFARSIVGAVRYLPTVKDYEEFFKKFEDQSIKDFLVIIDDLERIHENLSLADVLGFISVLKEQHKCRVIVILNEDQIEGNNREVMAKYREKVIDYEIEFSPTVTEAVEFFSWPTHIKPIALEVFSNLDSNNLRVIEKCREIVLHFDKISESASPETKSTILEQTLKISALHYLHEKVVNISGLKSFSYWRLLSKKGEEEPEGGKVVNKINYYPRDCDEVIAHYVKKGYVETGSLEKFITNSNAREARGNISDKYRKVFQVYHSNFHGTLSDIKASLKQFLAEHGNDLFLTELFQLKESCAFFGIKDPTKPYIKRSIETGSKTWEYSECTEIAEKISDRNLKLVIKKRLVEILKQNKPEVILKEIATRHSWNPTDETILDSYDSDYYKKWMLRESEDQLFILLKTILGIFKGNGANGTQKSIADKIIKALESISKTSKINKLRINKLVELKL